MLVAFSRAARLSRPAGLRALLLSRNTIFRPMSSHTQSVDFQKRNEIIPPISHPEEYNPDHMFEDEFEYGIAGEPQEEADEFELLKKKDRITLKVQVGNQDAIVHSKQGHEKCLNTMPLTAESRMPGTEGGCQ